MHLPSSRTWIPSLGLLGLLACGGVQSPDNLASQPAPAEEPQSEAAIIGGVTGSISSQYSDSPSGEEIAKVMDGSTSTKYLTFHTSVYLTWKASSAVVMNSYAMTSANDFAGRDPKNFNLQGSTNGSTWTTLNSQSNQAFSARFQKKTYAFTNSTAYLYYRLNITANNGDTSCTQLAEWDLTQAPIANPVTVYQHCDYTGTAISLPVGRYALTDLAAKGVPNDSVSSIKVAAGYQATLYQHDQFGGTALTLTGDDACLVDNSFNDQLSSLVIAKQGATDGWAGFVYPTVTFTDEATGLEGSTIFRNAIPDAAQMMREQCLAICKEIYSDNSDRRVNFTKLNLILQNSPNSVAGKWGAPPEIWIGISAQYLATFYHNNGNSLDAVNKEVRGVLSHEGTHGYQWEPKNCGAYDGSSVFWALIEGEADGVRAELTNWVPSRGPSRGGSVNSGYGTTGFFLSWCKHNKKPTFLIELNHAARDMSTFTWDAAFQQILGQNVQTVWNEYQATLP